MNLPLDRWNRIQSNPPGEWTIYIADQPYLISQGLKGTLPNANVAVYFMMIPASL